MSEDVVAALRAAGLSDSRAQEAATVGRRGFGCLPLADRFGGESGTVDLAVGGPMEKSKPKLAMATLTKDWADMSDDEKDRFVAAMADKLYPEEGGGSDADDRPAH